MILNTQMYRSGKTVSGKLGKKMTAYYTDGKDFLTGESGESIQVALNSVLAFSTVTDHVISGGLTKLYEDRGMVETWAVYRVTDNFEIA